VNHFQSFHKNQFPVLEFVKEVKAIKIRKHIYEGQHKSLLISSKRRLKYIGYFGIIVKTAAQLGRGFNEELRPSKEAQGFDMCAHSSMQC